MYRGEIFGGGYPRNSTVFPLRHDWWGSPFPRFWILLVFIRGTGGKVLEFPGKRYFTGRNVPPLNLQRFALGVMGGPLPSRWILLVFVRGTGEKLFHVSGKRYLRYRGQDIWRGVPP